MLYLLHPKHNNIVKQWFQIKKQVTQTTHPSNNAQINPIKPNTIDSQQYCIGFLNL